MQQVQVSIPAGARKYQISVGSNLLSKSGKLIRTSLGPSAHRLALISNKKVFKLYGSIVAESLNHAGFSVSTWLMREGEAYKSLSTTQQAVSFLSDQGLERTDGVVALGGGVVGDLAGFAAAIYLRGISFVQIPTTLLAQIDSSIGGKVGVNLPSGKNRLGAFHQPTGVIADIDTLQTLPRRELTAGWCECIKQGAIASRKLFRLTSDYLAIAQSESIRPSLQLENLISQHCAFKVSIVKGDERENQSRKDHRSRRILNFGHTVGHALEQLTNYRRFRHGEAVGHGMLVAGELSKNLGLLDQSELELLREGVRRCGSLPDAKDLKLASIIDALSLDKKRTGGYVQWVLLERIGKPRLVSGKDIQPTILRSSIRDALQLGKV